MKRIRAGHLLGLLLIILSTLSVPSSSLLDADSRFFGLRSASADLLWIRVAQDIPYMRRISPAEAEENMRILSLVVELEPHFIAPIKYGAMGLSLWGRGDLAMDLIEEGLRRNPDSIDLLLELGMNRSLLDEGDTEAAIAYLSRASSADDAPSLLGKLLASIQEASGDTVSAIMEWKEISRRFGDDPLTRTQAAEAIGRLRGRKGAGEKLTL